MRSPVVLLTGATGLLGSELLFHYLRATDDVQVKALVRGDLARQKQRIEALCTQAVVDPASVRWSRLELIAGDLERPELGLSTAALASLTSSVTHVVHSAANTDFSQSLEQARAANTTSTSHMLAFARRCRPLRALMHVSTLGVSGLRTGLVLENELEHTAGFANPYEQSKYEAEQLARAHMSELPIAVSRTATLIGDSRRGTVRQFNYMHRAFYLAYHGLLPVLPGDPRAVIDMIPYHYGAEALHFLTHHAFHPGTTYQLCAGPAKSFTLDELVETVFCVFQTSDASTRRDLRRFPIVSPEEFHRQMDEARADNRSRAVQAMAAMSYVMPQLSVPKEFDATNAVRDLDGSDIELPHISTYFVQLLEYSLRTRWGRLLAA